MLNFLPDLQVFKMLKGLLDKKSKLTCLLLINFFF